MLRTLTLKLKDIYIYVPTSTRPAMLRLRPMVRIITQESQEGLTIVGQKGLQGVDDQCRRMLHVGSLA